MRRVERVAPTQLAGRLRSRIARWSLRSRLSWGATVVIALWLLAVAVGVNVLLTTALSGQADSVLEARAEAVSATVQVDARGTVHIRPVEEDWALDIGTWVIDGKGTIVKRPEGATQDLDLAALYLSTQGEARQDVSNHQLRLLAHPVRDDQHQQVATIVTSTSLAPYGRLQRIFLWASVAVATLLLVVVHLALRASVRRALHPVQEMSETAERWSADDVERRFGLAARPSELAGLALTLDGVLDRVSAALRHEQRLTGELSHELRTPLARVRAELDLVRRRDEGTDPVATSGLSAIDAAVDDMQQIIETLLSAGRAGTRTAPGRCRPAEVVGALAADAAPLDGAAIGGSLGLEPEAEDDQPHRRPDLRNDVDDELVVGVDGAVLRRLLVPLVDNARRYATEAVEVHGVQRDGQVVLVVDDDGPGVRADDVDRVFVAGWRADPDDGHPGGGLGLALTMRLAQACGGTVRAVPRPDGGRFEVSLPTG